MRRFMTAIPANLKTERILFGALRASPNQAFFSDLFNSAKVRRANDLFKRFATNQPGDELVIYSCELTKCSGLGVADQLLKAAMPASDAITNTANWSYAAGQLDQPELASFSAMRTNLNRAGLKGTA